MCVTLYNNYISEGYKAFDVNAYCSPKICTVFLNNNPWVRALYTSKANFDTRTVKLNSGIQAVAAYGEKIVVTKEPEFVDFREVPIVSNAERLSTKLFRGN